MELRHLRYFTTVAAEGSFSRAAQKLNMAQPPLSRQIQQLEEDLGTRLLDRGRPLTLTQAGRYLYEQGLQILQRVDEAQAMTTRIGRGLILQFNIGFVASTLYDTLPDLMRRFRVLVPGVEVNLLEMTTLEQVAALKDGRIDVGFGRLSFNDDMITRRVLREERLWLAVPLDHDLGWREVAPKLADTAPETLVVYPKYPRPSYADQVLGFYRSADIQPFKVVEARELQTALGLVASGGGICVVPASARRLGRGDLTFVELDEPGMTSPIILSHRRSDESRLLKQMLQLAAKLGAPEAPGP
ncbi:LysR family transcriptional regulator [Aureimonas ureilytica]|uniref:LysR family transcriptional regulator n=1 Tax=Aureimonas ureilytica TaxID=401562 RepID=A0A175R5S5_9HYPH|nr:LysR family transcriptional regulator [Aureimonas ureilytica]KTQ85439.1 LysR family transcriptional regulator [Aureimonas ureilytica]